MNKILLKFLYLLLFIVSINVLGIYFLNDNINTTLDPLFYLPTNKSTYLLTGQDSHFFKSCQFLQKFLLMVIY